MVDCGMMRQLPAPTTATISPARDPRIQVAFVPIPADQLADSIAQLTPAQARFIVTTLKMPGVSRAEIARSASVGVTLATRWTQSGGPLHDVFYTAVQLARSQLGSVAVSSVIASASVSYAENDAALGSADNSADPKVLALQLRVRETGYKLLGLMSDQGPSISISIESALLRVQANREADDGDGRGYG